MSRVIESEEATTSRVNIADFSQNIRGLNRRSIIKQELLDWVQRALAFLCFFILFQVSIMINTQPDMSLVPLFVLDLKVLVYTCCSKKFPNVYKLIFSQQVMNQLCSTSFKILVLVHKNTKSFSMFILLIPIGVSIVTHILHKASKKEECRYLTWLILTLSKLIFFLTMLNIGLKEEKMIDWGMSGIIWPVYIGLCICGVLILGLILITLGAVCSWIEEEIPSEELISTFWLLFTLSGASMSLIFLILKVLNSSLLDNKVLFCIFPAIFLMVFILTTLIYLNNLIEWWLLFFSTSSSIGHLDAGQPVQDTTIHTTGVQELTENVVKRPPSLLIRISSSYFRPAEASQEQKTKRTSSLKGNNEDCTTVQRRTFSGPTSFDDRPQGICESPSAAASFGKVCEMCCENFCNAVVMECGHGGICYECSLEMWKSTGHCHMCRGVISQVLQIEKSKDTLVRVKSTTRAVYYDGSNA